MPTASRSWLPATLIAAHQLTATAQSLTFDVPGWSGHHPGQHVDVRLTSADGYSTQRSYSIASAPPSQASTNGGSVPPTLELAVQKVRGGEVSPYLVDEMRPGDQAEFRGPVGGWFTWRSYIKAPVLLIGGGSGVVPLVSMLRARVAGGGPPFLLQYFVRSPEQEMFADELHLLRAPANADPTVRVQLLYSREAPAGDPRAPRRVTVEDLVETQAHVGVRPRIYICGSTGFVERVAGMLLLLGHAPANIRTERFGASGP